MDKKISLPKGQFIDDTDAEGQGLFPTDDDVEGHVKPTARGLHGPPAAAGDRSNRSPGTAAKLHDSSDDDR